MTGPDLENRVILVTGACRGLGLAMSEAILDAGGRVAAMSVDAKQLDSTAEDLGLRYGQDRVHAVAGDVSVPADCRRAVDETLTRFGTLNGLINNAALGQSFANAGRENTIPFWEADSTRWARVIEVNVVGSFLMAHAAAPHMIANGWGRIVNITTSLGHISATYVTPYGPSKGAIEAMTIAWANELKETGVTVNSLIPGGASDTAMVAPIYREKGLHLLDPSVMKAPIVWLMSDHSDGHSGKRYVGKNWNADLPVAEAACRSFELPVYRTPQ